MKSNIIIPDTATSLFIKNILVFEETSPDINTILPFFADGYPGLMFHDTPDGQWVQPHNKKMPASYLHGQTLKPIELHMKGAYKMIVFQLYPFVINRFFQVDPKTLNDNCFELSTFQDWKTTEEKLFANTSRTKQVNLIQSYLHHLFIANKETLDFTVASALKTILSSKAQITVKDLCQKLHVTTRTLERRFMNEVGVSIKQFIQITRFQQSLEQLTVKDYARLTDIVYENGFADQSHFIRVFKAFTGQSPKRFLKKL